MLNDSAESLAHLSLLVVAASLNLHLALNIGLKCLELLEVMRENIKTRSKILAQLHPLVAKDFVGLLDGEELLACGRVALRLDNIEGKGKHKRLLH